MTSYDDWVSQVAKGRAENVQPNQTVTVPAGKPYRPIQFLRTDRLKYVGEIGRKGADFIYHFFPNQPIPNFEDKLGEAFFETFKLEERIQAAEAPELNSWAVRAIGFADNPLMEPLAIRLFDILDEKLK